ncbi:MAG: hypothetical protein KJ799_01875 [Bacteroidetes bacterium]|nr:hypothetical protein [Bacteroidota bacterium]MBU2505461.1 hypothetical protein [Bacteroidota bacterium]
MKTLIQIFAFISLLSIAAFGQTQFSILIDPGHGGFDGQGTPGARDTNFHFKNFFTLLKIFLA